MASPRRHDHDPHDHDQQDGNGDKGRDLQRFDAQGVGGHADIQLLLFVFHAAAAHEQAVGIDAVRMAGHQRAEIHAGENFQLGQIAGLDDRYFIHLIGQRLVQNGQIEQVADLHDIQVAEQLGAGQAAVSAQEAMGREIHCAFKIFLVGVQAAHGQAGSHDMPDRGLQHGVAGSVIDRQVGFCFGDRYEAHVARSVHVELGVILLGKLLVVFNHPAVGQFKQPPVIFHGGVQYRLVFLIVQLGHALGIGGDGAALVHLVPVFAEGGIGHDAQAHQKNEEEQQIG